MVEHAKRPLEDGSNTLEKKQKTSKSITEFFAKTSEAPIAKKEKVVIEAEVTESTTAYKPTASEDIANPVDFKKKFTDSLTHEQKELLDLEITTLEDSWFQALHKELLKPYFLELKRYLLSQKRAGVQVFPPEQDIYSWSKLTPLSKTKVVILGQDPYHNVNQAHGLAFSVKEPTPPPPSLKNMYKALKIDYPEFEIPKTGDLTKWAEQGVLLLNACLTVKAHNANSHAKKGWEQFTEKVLETVLSNSLKSSPDEDPRNLVLFLWGTPAQKRVDNLKLNLRKDNILVLRSVHPSPLSARRGYFEGHHYKTSNDWLILRGEKPVNWCLAEGNSIDY